MRLWIIGRVENQKNLNFNPGHVDSVVFTKTMKKMQKRAHFDLKPIANLIFSFTKELTQKYKGKMALLVFLNFRY